MSANNYILIEWLPEDYYSVTHRDADTGNVLGNLGVENNLEKAVAVANRFIKKAEEDGYGVEYGISIELKKDG